MICLHDRKAQTLKYIIYHNKSVKGGTMKLLRVLCVLALALCVTASVYAETQSVKVSGDLTMRGIYRNDYQLISQVNETPYANNTRSGIDGTDQSWAMTVAAVQVDADLTDNVTTVIRLLNQRDWNVANDVTITGTGLSLIHISEPTRPY